MTRRNKLIILVVYLLILASALPLYRFKRAAAAKKMTAELSAMRQEQSKSQGAAGELEMLRRLFPPEAATAAFVEGLYDAAKQSKIISHEVTSEAAPQGRSSGRPAAGGAKDELETYRFKIAIAGSYRTVAEYIRRVQNIERFKRISELKLAPAPQGITAHLTLELFSLKGAHAR